MSPTHVSQTVPSIVYALVDVFGVPVKFVHRVGDKPAGFRGQKSMEVDLGPCLADTWREVWSVHVTDRHTEAVCKVRKRLWAYIAVDFEGGMTLLLFDSKKVGCQVVDPVPKKLPGLSIYQTVLSVATAGFRYTKQLPVWTPFDVSNDPVVEGLVTQGAEGAGSGTEPEPEPEAAPQLGLLDQPSENVPGS